MNDRCPFQIETSQMNCPANQWTGLYMRGTLVVKGLSQNLVLFFQLIDFNLIILYIPELFVIFIVLLCEYMFQLQVSDKHHLLTVCAYCEALIREQRSVTYLKK